MAVALFGLHNIIYICGMKTAPTIVNADILTFSHRGVRKSLSAMEISTATLVFSVTFWSMKKSVSSSGIFSLNAGFAIIGLIVLYFILPNTKGVSLKRINNVI